MSIENMHLYVCKMAPVLPGDKSKDTENDVSVREQLGSIESHIEDLEGVRDRVCSSDMPAKYLNPMRTENTAP